MARTDRSVGWLLAAVVAVGPPASFGQVSCSIEQLTDFGPDVRLGDPAISEDGRRIAYLDRKAADPPAQQAFLLDLEAGTKQITGGPSVEAEFVAVSRDGQTVIVAATGDLVPGANPDRGEELFSYDVVTGAFTQHTDLFYSEPVLRRAVVSSAGIPLGFTTSHTEFGGHPAYVFPEIYYDGERFVSPVGANFLTFAIFVGMSDDGRWVLFHSNEDPIGTNPAGEAKLFFWDATADLLVRGAARDVPIAGGALSNDARTIAFAANEDDGRESLYLRDVASAAERMILSADDLRGLALDPDGNRVAFLREIDGVSWLSVLDTVTDTVADIVQDAASARNIEPDGNIVLFSSEVDLVGSNPDGNHQVFRATCDLPGIFGDGFESGDLGAWSSAS